jgi:hypothetical protein
MDQKLTYIFGLINEWLRYAETKNGALVALSGAALAGVANALSAAPSIPTLPKVFGICSVLCLAISCLIALLSFVPRINRWKLSAARKGVSDIDRDNLIFFADLSKYTPEEFLDSMALRYFQNDKYATARQKSHLDLANQIIINSRITSAKFALFKIGVWFLISAVPLGLVAFVCAEFFSLKE